MNSDALGSVLHHLRRLTGAADLPDSDGDLLDRFARGRDQAAFAILLQRHGPLVWSVCRRLLDDHEAEDAFQATFLILVRKAGSIARPERLSKWLFGVAYRIARRAQARRGRYVTGQESAMEPTAPTNEEAVWRKLRPILNEELHRLPEKYRVPVLLCYVEGKTQDDAAQQLGWTAGSVKGRLERARELLRGRLSRRGVALSAAGLSTILAEIAVAQVPEQLLAETLTAGVAYAAGETATVGPALALAQGLLRSAVLTRGLLAASLFLGVSAAGGALWEWAGLAQPPADQAADVPIPAVPPAPQVRTDRFGDALPEPALTRLGTVRWRPGQRTRGLAVSGNGTRLAVANEAGVSLWDAASGQQLRVFQTEPADRVIFSADGGTLVSHTSDHVCSWDVRTGKALADFELAGPVGGELINDVAISANGKVLAALGSDAEGKQYTLHIYEGSTGRSPRHWIIQDMPEHLALTPDGKLLAATVSNKQGYQFRLWDTATGKEVRSFGPRKVSVNCLVFAPDGKTLACGGQGLDDQGQNGKAMVEVWDTATGQLRQQVRPGNQYALAAAFSADSRLLATGGWDQAVRVWDVALGKQLHAFPTSIYAVHAVAFAPNGKMVFAGDNASTLRRWDLATGQEAGPKDVDAGWVDLVAWSGDGKTLRTHSAGVVSFWDPATGRQLRRLETAGALHLWASAIIPAKDLLAGVTGEEKNEVCLWDLRTGKVVRRLTAAGQVGALRFTPDGSCLAGAVEKTVVVWDPATGEELRTLEGHDREVRALAFSPDGRFLATGGGDETVRIWDRASGQEVHRLLRGTVPEPFASLPVEESVEELTFTPDGHTLVGCDNHGILRIWDIHTPYPLKQVPTGRDGDPREKRLHRVAVSPDGRIAAVGGFSTEIGLYELATGTEIRRLSGHRGRVLSLTFSADGRTLVSGSQDTTALVWDLAAPTAEEAKKAARLSEAEQNALWRDLARAEAAPAWRAVRVLVATPDHGVVFLEKRLAPASTGKGPDMKQLISDLDSPRFGAREKAEAALEQGEDRAESAVDQALAGKPSVEVQRRLERLAARLKSAVPSEEVRRGLRAVALLELAGDAPARVLLTTLAKGAPDSRLTRESQAALRRLDERRAP